jgi:hypothetical protein
MPIVPFHQKRTVASEAMSDPKRFSAFSSLAVAFKFT